MEHGQEGEDVHARGSVPKLWMPSLGELGHNVPVGEANLGIVVRLIFLILMDISNRFW